MDYHTILQGLNTVGGMLTADCPIAGGMLATFDAWRGVRLSERKATGPYQRDAAGPMLSEIDNDLRIHNVLRHSERFDLSRA